MNKISDEIGVIRPAAWVIAACMGLGMWGCLMYFAMPHDPKLNGWPVPFQVAFSTAMSMILVGYILVLGYVNGDARRRAMRYGMWTLLAIFVPNGIGVILYFIMRDPIPQRCPHCAATVKSKGTFCPACGGALGNTCPACHSAVEAGWSHCMNCGGAL